MQDKVTHSQNNNESVHGKKSTSSVINDRYTERAAKEFDVEPEQVTSKQREWAKAQVFAENYGFRGTPLRSYYIGTSGTVEFIQPVA
jgi:hypothetical protein